MIPQGRHPARRLAWVVLVAGLVAGCGGPILANAPAVQRASAPPTTAAPIPHDPQPIAFPADDGPHDRLTEWWYYTGHLRDEAGDWYGFEFVVFRAERGGFPVTWASHLALTDETGGSFHYAQRSEIGPQVDRSPTDDGQPAGFDLSLAGPVAGAGTTSGPSAAPAPGPAWAMSGGGGHDHLSASLGPAEATRAGASFGLDLTLSGGAAVLHGGDGWVDFGPAGGSYYYSRPRMPATGTLVIGGRSHRVTGEAWFDHQWGDFIAVGGGGWDWFAVNLDDGTDLTLSVVRGTDGKPVLVYGTLRRADQTVVRLAADAFRVTASGHWTSPHTGATYPAGWRIEVPGEELAIDLSPTVADQELDTRSTSGVAYWEGSQVVRARRAGRPLAGQAYVELTGYARVNAAP